MDRVKRQEGIQMTEKQSRYVVGTDNATPATVRTEVMNDGARFLASLWAKHKADESYDRVFFENGKRVQVIIREVKEEHEGKV